ncbi:response regulator [Corallococcus sp. CA054B]|uniref:response regulator transcription factor n=1 Tax=Corallococcus sp. CA054B TaxID=2316734 RepID=UPI000EA0D44F|nr:response regulator [Corallococcus sp. CA054B]RKG65056.1 response regulator [Corallococcus sp. CA054B]
MKTVLVVDDELDIAEAIQAILEEEQLRVVVCGNGREALARLKEEKPDLAIIDVMMPVMNGYETIDAIRKDGTHHFPILVMSAIQPPKTKMEEQQWAGFLKKPFSLRDLVDTVERLTSS